MVPDRWQPSDEDDLRRAIDNSDLVENHWFEGKREVNSSESSRRKIAKAIASLAIDGGTLVVGIEEIKAERTWSLQPQPLQGLSERIALIATSAIDPPVPDPHADN